MRKILIFLFALLTIWSCSNEVFEGNTLPSSQPTTFVRLLDDGTQLAGKMTIVSEAPNAELTWITTPDCNLDTTQLAVSFKNGVAELPIKWQHKQTNGKYAPEGMAFKAWIRVKAGDNLSYIPLILSEKVDSVKLMQTVQTRAMNTTPRVISLNFKPAKINLQNPGGGTSTLEVSGAGTVNIDYTGITDAMKINKTILPPSVTATQTLNFNWVNNQPPTEGFTAIVTASTPSEVADSPLYATLILVYDPSGASDVDLQYVSNNMPTGKLPATSSIYTFTFTGTYQGGVQLRTLSNGKVLYTATVYQYPTNQPKARVPENTGAERPIAFEYRAGAGRWIPIPQADRIQEGTGVTPPVPGTKPSYGPISPAGDIPDKGGEYNCVFSNYAGVVDFRAVSGNGRELAKTSGTMTAGGFAQMFLTIPEAKSLSDNLVKFQYSIDGGVTWTDMETRKQIVEAFATGHFTDMPDFIPAAGGTYHYVSQGTLSALLTIVVRDGSGTIAESKGAAGGTIIVSVPANTTGQQRALTFWYVTGDQPGKFNYIQRGDQLGN